MDFEKFDTAIIPSDGIRVVSFSQRKGTSSSSLPQPDRSIIQLFRIPQIRRRESRAGN